MNTEKLMPIVPGCRAVIVGANLKENAHLIGTVVMAERKGVGSGWYVKHPSPVYTHGVGRDWSYFSERNLMRIDGGDFADEFMRELTSDVDEIKRRIERC